MAATDAAGNPSNVASGELIEAAWGNAVVDRVVKRFATKAALDAWAAPPGAVAMTLDLSRYWFRSSAGTWIWLAGNPPRFRIVGGGAGQIANSGALTVCTFAGGAESFDTDAIVNYPTTGTAIVPAGFAGRWRIDYAVRISASAAGVRNVFVDTGAAGRFGQFTLSAPAGSAFTVAGSTDVQVAAGNQIQIAVFHDIGAAATINNTASEYFQGTYLGG